jgi:acid stress-induced BolA-like protein IbaG/YrbA
MDTEDIKNAIAEGLLGSIVMVDGDGTHFAAIVVSEEFRGKSMVQQHQLVYKTLGEKVGVEIHALSLKTLTPDEWEKEKTLRSINN